MTIHCHPWGYEDCNNSFPCLIWHTTDLKMIFPLKIKEIFIHIILVVNTKKQTTKVFFFFYRNIAIGSGTFKLKSQVVNVSLNRGSVSSFKGIISVAHQRIQTILATIKWIIIGKKLCQGCMFLVLCLLTMVKMDNHQTLVHNFHRLPKDSFAQPIYLLLFRKAGE